MLSPERRQFIGDIANDEWVDRLVRANAPEEQFDAEAEEVERARQRFVAEATDPDELHHFVERWNWDGGAEVMRAVAQNPACDRGTALMIYWLTGPHFFLSYGSHEEVPEGSREGYDLVSELEPRLVAGDFATARIAYDPRTDGLVNRVPANAKRELPPEVYEPVGG